MKPMRVIALTTVLCLAALAGAAHARHVHKDFLVNPSFEKGETGEEPYGWASEAAPTNDKTAFVKAPGGRPKGDGKPEDPYEVQLTVKGDNKKSWGSQLVNVKLTGPTQITFSAWVKADGTIPAGDYKPAISIEGLKIDKDTNRWVTPEGGGRKSTEFTPTSEWTRYAVSKVFPADTERIKLAIGTYSRGVVISVDDAELSQGLSVPEFDVDKEGESLAQLVKDAGQGDEKAAELQKLFDAIKQKLATANDESASKASRSQAAKELPDLIKDYAAKKKALKDGLLDSLLE